VFQLAKIRMHYTMRYAPHNKMQFTSIDVGETRIYWCYIVLQIWYPYRAFEHRSWSHTLCDRFSWYLHTMLKTLEFSSLRLVQKKNTVWLTCSLFLLILDFIKRGMCCATHYTPNFNTAQSHSFSFLTIVFTLGSTSKHAKSIIYSVLPKKKSW